MSEPHAAAPAMGPEAAALRILRLYEATVILAVAGILGLVVYVVRLGAIVGPGVQSSFGFAVALMFLFAALATHVVDRIYRSWPFGRKFVPTAPGPVTDRSVANFLLVVLLLAVLGGGAYILGSLMS